MAHSGTNPTTWEAYQGRASLSNNSIASSVVAEDTGLLDDGDDDVDGGVRSDRRRYIYPFRTYLPASAASSQA